MIRTFYFSSKSVGGYQVNINLDNVCTIDDIIDICVTQLIQFLLDNNLTDTLLNIQNKKFHLHDVTIEEIKKPDSRMFYICECNG